MEHNKRDFKIGDTVVIQSLKGPEPNTWKNNGTIIGFEKDVDLSNMNSRGIAMFRVSVVFEAGPYVPTLEDEKRGIDECYKASVLPCMLRHVKDK